MKKKFDIVIIGAGIIGLAIAKILVENENISVAIIEAENNIAMHQSGNNSGVIHSGVYYKPGSKKAINCINGRELMYNYCEEKNIPYKKCGKIIVALNDKDLPKLRHLEIQGLENKLDISRLNSVEISEKEPNAIGKEGLWIPETGIVDYSKVAESFRKDIINSGGIVYLNTKLVKIKFFNDYLQLITNNESIKAKYLINCGGLQSDRIAYLFGIKSSIKIIPFRGEYFEIKNDNPDYIKGLLYPVPDSQFPFLGVHFTKTIHGNITIGPNAVFAFSRNGYSIRNINIKDLFECFTYGGFRKLVKNNYKKGFQEFYRSLNKYAFLNLANQMVPGLHINDIVKGGSGVRAQALGMDGILVDDFVIKSGFNSIHILNAPSPAATASLSIGKTIFEKVKTEFL